MDEYRDLALEAIATLGTVVDILLIDKATDLYGKRISDRVSSLAMKLAVYDSDRLDERVLGDIEAVPHA